MSKFIFYFTLKICVKAGYVIGYIIIVKTRVLCAQLIIKSKYRLGIKMSLDVECILEFTIEYLFSRRITNINTK